MSLCGCFSPSPRLGRGNVYETDLEPPEVFFTERQNRFSQEVLLGLRGQTASTTAGRGSATVYFPQQQAEGLQQAPSQHFRRVNSTAIGVDPPPVQDNLKKDDIWTQSRQNLEEAIEEEKENTSHHWDPDLLTQEQRLEQRLDKLNLDMYIMGSDGACQFRAISYGLFGKEDYHKAVRRKAVKYMSEHKQDFEAFLGESFQSYMKEMAQTTSWGDELTLRALSEAYGVVVNVITSDQQHWFMRYEPEVQPKNSMEVFVTYIAPIHYNAVRRKTQAARMRNMGSFSRQRSSRIQMAMDRAASQSGTEQYRRLTQQKMQAQADAAAPPNGQQNASALPNGHISGPRRSRDSRQGQGLHNIMSGLQSVREEDSPQPINVPAQDAANDVAPVNVPQQAAATPVAAPAAPPQAAALQAAAATGGAQFIVGGKQTGATQGQEQSSPGLPPTRAKPVKIPSRGRSQGYAYGMSKSSSPLPVLQSPFAAAAAAPL